VVESRSVVRLGECADPSLELGDQVVVGGVAPSISVVQEELG
jgi:hypothetical protein